MNSKRNMCLRSLCLALTFCCLGCGGGGGDSVDLGSVTGVVTMDGKPLADAIVVFAPEQGNPSSGRTDAVGKYELSYMGRSKGAILGSNKVSISTGPPLSTEEGEEADLASTDEAGFIGSDESIMVADSSSKKEPIPARYNSRTELKEDVVAGDNTFDFDLESK